MGNSAFYYYPHPDTLVRPRQTVDLGEIISDLQIRPYRVSHDGVSVGGRLSRVNRRVGMSVRIINERFTDDQLAEKLYTMADHMERGGSLILQRHTPHSASRKPVSPMPLSGRPKSTK